MEERYRWSHRERKIKREIGLGERKRDRSGRERENHRKRGIVGEKKIGRETGGGRERYSHIEGEGETGVRER